MLLLLIICIASIVWYILDMMLTQVLFHIWICLHMLWAAHSNHLSSSQKQTQNWRLSLLHQIGNQGALECTLVRVFSQRASRRYNHAHVWLHGLRRTVTGQAGSAGEDPSVTSFGCSST